MSIETLKEDLKQNLATLAAMTPELATPAEIVRHLKDTLWPTLESLVDELAEVDDCVADLVSNADDILQPETAQVFAAVLAGAATVAAALKLRIDPKADAQLMRVVTELETNIKSANVIMTEIVIDDGSFDDEEDDDEDDEDDADDDTDGEGSH